LSVGALIKAVVLLMYLAINTYFWWLSGKELTWKIDVNWDQLLFQMFWATVK
jgi:hypothetical protein